MSNKYEHTRQWWTEWKTYTDGLEIPVEWEDVTSHNDDSPSFQFRNFRIWLNAPDTEWRFAVNVTDDDGEIIYDDPVTDLLLTHDINEVIELINN
jgi:hypothetical protein